MQHALSARAASFGAATAIIGAAVFAALSITYTVSKVDSVDHPIVESYTPIIDPPAPEPAQQAAPRENDRVIIADDTFLHSDPIENAPEQFTDQLIGAIDLGPMEITRPQWLRRPENVARFYPTRAIQRNMEGQVRLDCLVAVGGALNCRVVEETPLGWGFGEAALRIAREYRMSPALRAGVPVEGRYRMIVPFNLD